MCVCVSVCACTYVCVCAYVCVLVSQLCLALWTPVNCSSPDSSVYGIPKASMLEWVTILFSGDLPDPGLKPWSLALQTDYLLSEPRGKPRHREKKAQIPKKPRGNTESSPNVISLGKSSLTCFL